MLSEAVPDKINISLEAVPSQYQKYQVRMISIRQVKAARALLGWSQDDLAQRSGVSKPTIARLETADGLLGGYAETREKIVMALGGAGILFIQENGEGPGVRLKKASSG